MSSEQQITANRENAKKSTGPVTDTGKAVISTNALRHGLTSARPIIPGMESPEAWDGHLAATISALAPHGHVEGLLAERIALVTWRLGRVVRFESESIALLQDQAEEVLQEALRFTLPCWIDRTILQERLQEAEEQYGVMTQFQTATDHETISSEDAAFILAVICEEVGIDAESEKDCDVPEHPGLGAMNWTDHEWTVGVVRDYGAALARKGEARRVRKGISNNPREFSAVWGKALKSAMTRVHGLRSDYERQERQLDQWRRQRMLPDTETLNKISRYEGHLERSLFRTMQELRRLQEARQIRPEHGAV